MSRHMITANREIFAALDRFCATRGIALQNAGKPRWIASEPRHRHFLMDATVGELISFSAGRKLARFDLSTESFLCTIGFDQETLASGPLELELNPAFLTVALYELQPRPIGSVSNVRQVVEFSDRGADPSYSGHSFEALASLFPSVRFFEIPFRTPEQTWSTFFRTCVDECEFGPSWIDEVLADTLRSMCDLDAERIPYRVLCRSIFDGDPSNFFLAQYRCLEALYAYSSAEDLIRALDLKQSWGEVATVLEDKLGWYPREEGSLIKLLSFASQPDLRSILDATGTGGVLQENANLISSAAKQVYWLRNSIVHYRPAQHGLRTEAIDWVLVCKAMAGIVVDVYCAVFTGTPVNP
jgi:hypothetical protein